MDCNSVHKIQVKGQYLLKQPLLPFYFGKILPNFPSIGNVLVTSDHLKISSDDHFKVPLTFLVVNIITHVREFYVTLFIVPNTARARIAVCCPMH